MKDPKILIVNYSGNILAKNSIYNLLGYGLPLLIALLVIPLLIKGLGEEKFGILNLIWIVIGYFSFFDFGIGRTVTQIVAEKIGLDKTEEISEIFWTSFLLIFIISILGIVLLIFANEYLVYNFFKISEELQSEVLSTFYLISFAIPIVTTTAVLRGILEAYQKFAVINIIRTILGISSFILPFFCLIFTNNLVWIVVILVILRIIIWIIYLEQIFKLNINKKGKSLINLKLLKPIIRLSSWITISNIIVPILTYVDRIFIGGLISATAITYYATPFEIVTKMLLIPGALTGVLFPAFSANYLNNPDFTKKIFSKSIKYTFLVLFPITFFIITFANEGMTLWLGSTFATNSAYILQILAIGVMFNSLAYIPFTFLQGIRKPDIPAKVNLLELPFYLILLWWSTKEYGITGTAFIWMLRMIIDALIIFSYTFKRISIIDKLRINKKHIFAALFLLFILFPIFVHNLKIKVLILVIVIASFIILSWKSFLLKEEKLYLTSKIKLFKSLI